MRFHTLNRETHNRVVSRYVDAITGKEKVQDEDEVKGYHAPPARMTTSSSRMRSWKMSLWTAPGPSISMSSLPRDFIEWIWLDTPYYLAPNDPVGQEAFSVIRDAMLAAEDMVGISRS